jgi:hypothetical protein
MARLYETLLLGVSTAFCLFTAVLSFASPVSFGGRLGLTVAGVDGLNEVRAQYGGFFLAVAVLGGLSLAGVVTRKVALTVNVVVFGGLIAGRLVSLALDTGVSGYGETIRALFFIDSMGFATAATALALAVGRDTRRSVETPSGTNA